MRKWLGSIAVAMALLAAAAAPAAAASPAEDQLKSEIDGALEQIKVSTNGVLRWEGSDKFELSQADGGAVALITNARFAIRIPDEARVVFDRIEIRRTLEPGGNRVKFAMVLPTEAKLTDPKGEEMKLTLKDAKGSMIVEEPESRPRASEISAAGARIEHVGSGSWASFGPLNLTSTVTAGPDGGWTIPTTVELKQIEFFVSDGPVTGIVEKISYDAHAAGPSLAAFDKARDDLAALRLAEGTTPDERTKAIIALLPEFAGAFGKMDGKFEIDGTTVRDATGAALAALKEAWFGVAMDGLSGEAASLRFTIGHDGLELSPSLLEPDKVPHKVTLDFGFENVSTAALRTMFDVAAKMQGASEAEQQQATGKLLGAAAMLHPVFRIYHFVFDVKDAGVDATAEARGSPLSPKGYTAEGDVKLRGVDALPALIDDAPFAAYLPLLKELGKPDKTADGTSVLGFRIASTPQQRLSLNGHDITAWISDDKPGPARILRPADPPMEGADVGAVQRALAAAKAQDVPQSGVYDGATAAAVARYQKQAGINVSGAVDAATRDRLGVKPAAEPGKPGVPAPRR